MTLKPCVGCQTPTSKTRCPTCQTQDQQRIGSASARGYGYRWLALSRRARRLQPFCTTCGHPGTADNPLTVDHKPSAWQRKAAGKVIRLCDTEVLCLRHNVELGSSRPGSARANADRPQETDVPTGGTAHEASPRQRVRRKAGYTPDPSLTPWTVI